MGWLSPHFATFGDPCLFYRQDGVRCQLKIDMAVSSLRVRAKEAAAVLDEAHERQGRNGDLGAKEHPASDRRTMKAARANPVNCIKYELGRKLGIAIPDHFLYHYISGNIDFL